MVAHARNAFRGGELRMGGAGDTRRGDARSAQAEHAAPRGRTELSRSAPTDVLLATDLHAGNVLRARREPWLVIDPKPFVAGRRRNRSCAGSSSLVACASFVVASLRWISPP